MHKKTGRTAVKGKAMQGTELFSHQLNLSKYALPPAPTQPYPNERLLKRLTRAARQKYVLIQAPRGYGKNSLLSQWYHILPHADRQYIVWFRVDSDDSNPSCFWSNLVATMEKCWPGIREAIFKSVEVLKQSSIHELLISIANHIMQLTEPDVHYLIIMTKFEAFKFSESEAQFFVFSNMLPSNIHIIISSRIYLNNQLIRQDTYSELSIIGVKELSLSKMELGSYLEDQLGQKLSDVYLDKLHAKSEGWPLAVHILLQTVQSGTPVEVAIDELTGNNHFLSEFIFEGATADLPPRISSFIIETAFLKNFCAELCNYVTRIGESADIIRYLERNGLFTYALDNDRVWFRYHPLFAQWLQGKAMNLRHDILRSLNHRAGQWYRNEKLQLPSTKYVIAATDDILVSRLAQFVFDDLASEYSLLLPWLFSLDETSLEQEPRFCLLAAWAYVFSGRPGDALAWCEKATLAIGPERSSASERLELIVRMIEAKCQVLQGHNEKGRELSAAILEEIDSPMDGLPKMVLYQNLAEADEQMGNIETAMQFYNKAMTLARANHFEFLTGLTRYQTIQLLYMQGKLSKCESLCRAAIAECPQDFSVYGALYALLGLVKIEQNRLEETDIMVQRAFKRVSADRNIDIFLDVCIAYSRYFAALQRYADAQLQLTLAFEEIHKSSDIPPRGVAYRVFVQQADNYLAQNDIASAEEVLREFESLTFPQTAASRLSMTIAQARIEMAQAKVAGLESDREVAGKTLVKLRDCIQQAEQMGYRLFELESLILAAIVSYQLRASSDAMRLIKKALTIAKEESMIRKFIDEGEIVMVLLMELLSSGHAGYTNEGFIRLLLRVFEKAQESRETGVDPGGVQTATMMSQVMKSERLANLWNLTNREQEVLRMLQDGLTRKDIAIRFCTSQNTVKTHIAHIYEKLDVHSVPEMLRTLMEHKLL